MPFINFTAGDKPTAAQFDTMFRQTVMSFATTTARDTDLTGSLADGMLAYTTTTPADTLWIYNGTSWEIESEPRQTWTPTTVTQGVSVAISSGGWYQRSRGTVRAVLNADVSGAGTNGSAIAVTLPWTAVLAGDIGGSYYIEGAGTFVGHTSGLTTTSIVFVHGTGSVGTTFALAASHKIKFQIQSSY